MRDPIKEDIGGDPSCHDGDSSWKYMVISLDVDRPRRRDRLGLHEMGSASSEEVDGGRGGSGR